MSNDYLYDAVENVRRKSAAALELLSNGAASAGAQAVGVVEPPADIVIDAALIAETQRTLDLAVMALEEIRGRDQKENKQDG
jgi:hypothetical protein